ncbi:MAG: hypothetical protein ABI999_08925 [Acidobacteriota bacterium]
MILSFFLIMAITAGGFALTYLFADGEPFLWRLAAGNVAGSAVFGTPSFVLACAFGLNVPTVVASLALTLAGGAVFAAKANRKKFEHDWQRAKGKLQGFNSRKFAVFCYYLFFIVLFWLFFGRAMFEMPDGIYTGGSHNLGDLPFHLGAIFSFTDGNNFPPINPSFAGAKFSYPFIADVVTAAFMKLGCGVEEAMFAQNFSWALALLVVLDRFVARVTGEWLSGKIATFLLFFSGGLGFIWLVSDYSAQASGFLQFFWHLPHDYTMNDYLSWGNSLITLFITQRSLLFGMPLAIVALSFLWTTFAKGDENEPRPTVSQAVVVGLLAGCLPLIHLHSLFVLFIVTAFLIVFRPAQWKCFIAFGIGVSIVAIPELVWSIVGTASRTSEFIGWHFGWDAKPDENILWFWIRNTGLLFPLLIAGMTVVYLRKSRGDKDEDEGKIDGANSRGHDLLLFYVPFVFCFALSNVAKLAPWEWDNVKVLVYWYVASTPFICIALVWAWRTNAGFKIATGFCFAILIASGGIDVWRTISGHINSQVFDRESVQIAAKLRATTEPRALFLNAPSYNSAIVLSGRISLIRFPGHLWSHGIDYGGRESDVNRIYAGGPAADALLAKYGVDYVLFSPDERALPNSNEAYFQKYPIAAQLGQYRVFKIR